MKLMHRGEEQLRGAIFDALTGHRCDEIVLNKYDVLRLIALSTYQPHQLTEWLNTLSCRFAP